MHRDILKASYNNFKQSLANYIILAHAKWLGLDQEVISKYCRLKPTANLHKKKKC